jgi:hypothetical protein
MIARDLQTVASVTGGALHGANAGFGRVVSDSRAMEAGALFVALARAPPGRWSRGASKRRCPRWSCRTRSPR